MNRAGHTLANPVLELDKMLVFVIYSKLNLRRSTSLVFGTNFLYLRINLPYYLFVQSFLRKLFTKNVHTENISRNPNERYQKVNQRRKNKIQNITILYWYYFYQYNRLLIISQRWRNEKQLRRGQIIFGNQDERMIRQ